MIYVDTSAIVKLYIKEKDSKRLSDFITNNNKALPLTALHELELVNAINLKVYRKEITQDKADYVINKFYKHENEGIFFRPPIDWLIVFKYAMALSQSHSKKIGSRSLDILHVTSALFLKIDSFLTFDKKQAQIASLSGLKKISL